MADHGRVAYRGYPTSPVLVPMVVDELLVAKAALDDPEVKDALEDVAVDTGHSVFEPLEERTGQFENLEPKPNPIRVPDDVHIFQLTPEADGEPRDLAETIWKLRATLGRKGLPAALIAPNHVVIPAPADYHTCPWGPPDVADARQLNTGRVDKENIEVVVIDAGYVPSSTIGASTVNACFGEWFDPGPPSGWMPESVGPPGVDPLDQVQDDRLDALAGHANFVAGVVLQGCPTAVVRIVSHNASLVEGAASMPLPTEAAVARSLWIHGQGDAETDRKRVVNVGFAFATLPDSAELLDLSEPGPPSWSFQAVLDILPDTTIVVAPAGNQGSVTPQYPAAFGEVIGVGSVRPNGNKPSKFSNRGGWVDCSTQGDDVVSTFIDGWTDKETEEPETTGPKKGTRPKKTFVTGWAKWSGTSFAAPKVAAAIATEQLANPTGTLQDAWLAVQARSTAPSSPAVAGMGLVLDGLLPT